MEFLKEAAIFIVCWALGTACVYLLGYIWDFNVVIGWAIFGGFFIGLIIRFLPHALEDLF